MPRLALLLTTAATLFLLATSTLAGTLSSGLASTLGEGRRCVSAIITAQAAGQPFSVELSRLGALREELAALRLLQAERSVLQEQRTETLNSLAATRQQSAAAALANAMDELLEQLGSALTDTSTDSLRGVIESIDRLLPRRSRPLLGTLPYRHTHYSPRAPADTPPVLPAYKGGDRTIHAADTAASPEAPHSREIVELAQTLQWNPVLIYEWVKNNVATEWYYGSMKGAVETLRQRSGNDADQASLLVALLRAASFPARYVRGTIQFFPDLDTVRNLTGLDDPLKIADFFRRAGIPFRPVVSGGSISNFQIEHVWVEAYIPYANYRGAVLDEQGKIWLGLDTSIKPQGYLRSQGDGIPAGLLATFRDDYLSTPQSRTPLELLTATLDRELSLSRPGATWTSLRDTAMLVPDVLKFIPDSMQFRQITVTGEYQALPDELKHQVSLTAAAGGNELFTITLDAHLLSNRRLALRAEPESVEDQNIIDAYGGLDNTPPYLVRLRPVLTLDGERLIVAVDGLPMGDDFTLTIAVSTPGGTERIRSSQINGNLSVIGVVAQQAMPAAPIGDDDDAEAVLFKEASRYIDRWNKSEDDLAALLGQRISRPTVTIALVGGQIRVTRLLELPHEFTWQGVYLDAAFKRSEVTGRNGREQEFMRLSGLQGSVLEQRIFEDDLQVPAVSTARLLQFAREQGIPLVTIEKSNSESLLPTLLLDATVKDDIADSVNQGLTVTIPQTDISYLEWRGTGYLKEDPTSGESGWMLSGGIAGSMSAATSWVNSYLKDTLGSFNTKPSKQPPARILKVSAVDRQRGTVGTQLKQKLAVLVLDKDGRPVKGAQVTFRVMAGGGSLGSTQPVTSSATGIAAVDFIPGQQTSDNTVYMRQNTSDKEPTQVGLNIVGASLATPDGPLELLDKFSAYGMPDKPYKLVKIFGDEAAGLVNGPAGSLMTMAADQYGNPVSNVLLRYSGEKPEINILPEPPPTPLPALPAGARNISFYNPDACTNPYPVYGDCETFGQIDRLSNYNGTQVGTITGDTVNTRYTIRVTAPDYPEVAAVTLTKFSLGARSDWSRPLTPTLIAHSLEAYTPDGHPANAVQTGQKLTTPLTTQLLLVMDNYTLSGPFSCTNKAGLSYDCWRVVPSGTSRLKKVNSGKISFKVATGDGTFSGTANLSDPANPNNPDNGKYQAWFTAGMSPRKNTLAVSGSATLFIPDLQYDPVTRGVMADGYAMTSLNADKKQLREIEVKLPINCAVAFDRGTGRLYVAPLNEKWRFSAPMPVDNDQLFDPASGAVLLPDDGRSEIATVFAVDTKLEVKPQTIYIDADGRTKQDTTLAYSILPPEYRALASNITLYEQDQAGKSSVYSHLPGDSVQGGGTTILLSGWQWNPHNQYQAQVSLNNGSGIQINGTQVPINLGIGAMIPDYNHDRSITAADRIRVEKGDTYYFWVNDDDGNGDTEGSGIPGSGIGSPIDPAHLKVDGTRDLIDFFPVHLDLKELFTIYDPATYSYRLRNADGALNYVVTDLKPAESGGYLTGENKDDNGKPKGIDYVQSLASAPTTSITDTGFTAVSAPYLQLKPEVIEQIKQGRGVILIEAYKKTTNPLVLEVYKGTTLVYSSLKLDLRIDGVEQMFRHKNLVEEGGGPSQATVFETGIENRLEQPKNFPDSETEPSKNFVFVHGYNVNPHQARGWHAEMFKRLYWSGSKAKFWGVTWYGSDTQLAAVTADYHINVIHAFDTAPFLKTFLVSNVKGDISIAAHSLGNMLVSSMLTDYKSLWSSNNNSTDPTVARIKTYFMLDAAVAKEAYDEDAKPDTSYLSTDGKLIPCSGNCMDHPDWANYESRLLASEWYTLFDSTDNRSKLTWRGRFKERPTGTAYYNFYSSGEEVLGGHNGKPEIQDMGMLKQAGHMAWALQEKLKGRQYIDLDIDIMGSGYGGWGFNVIDYGETDPVSGEKTNKPISPFLINGTLSKEKLRTTPFFSRKASDSALYNETTGSDYAASTTIRNRLLAQAIPARTLPAGANILLSLSVKYNKDMQFEYKIADIWPSSRIKLPNWRHGDAKDVSYSYIYNLFDAIIKYGEIK